MGGGPSACLPWRLCLVAEKKLCDRAEGAHWSTEAKGGGAGAAFTRIDELPAFPNSPLFTGSRGPEAAEGRFDRAQGSSGGATLPKFGPISNPF